ncbi:deoxyribonuclease-1-like [Liolophura sinensis]|uniref:deoxyribonuclease-1-like n=1 Tax=Liolophura sinensis TaxID=3198878 RepID=UPI0031591709
MASGMDISVAVLIVMGVFLATALTHGSPLKVASFNIKWLDERKVTDHSILDVLVKVLGRYDLILIEELRGNPQDVISKLVAELNIHTSSPYAFKISPPLGRTSYKEEYVYIYRISMVVIHGVEHYSDPGDLFEREPFIIQVHLPYQTLKDFVFIGIHTKPDKTKEEIGHLVQVYEHVVSKYGIKDVLLAGDMNAGCHYMSESEVMASPLHGSRFTWLIPSSVDTTVSTHTDCAYDRFVVAGDKMRGSIIHGSAKRYNYQQALGLSFDQAWAVSDHFPIEVEIS